MRQPFFVLQGGLLFEEFPEMDRLESFLDSIKDNQNEIFTLLKSRKEVLDNLSGLLNYVISDKSIQNTFDGVTPHTKFIGIYNASGQLEAESLKLFLNSLGFPVRIYQESAGVAYGLTVGPLGLAEIMVPEEDTEQAKDVLLAMEKGLFIQEDDDLLEYEEEEL